MKKGVEFRKRWELRVRGSVHCLNQGENRTNKSLEANNVFSSCPGLPVSGNLKIISPCLGSSNFAPKASRRIISACETIIDDSGRLFISYHQTQDLRCTDVDPDDDPEIVFAEETGFVHQCGGGADVKPREG